LNIFDEICVYQLEVRMKKWMVLFVAAILIIGCGQGEKEDAVKAEVKGPDQESVAPVAQTIAGNFEGAMSSIAAGEISKGIGMLLDITMLTGPETVLPEGFKDSIEKARAAYEANDMAAGGESVRSALKIWNPKSEGEETDVAGDAESSTPGPIAQIFKEKLTTAQNLMKEGDAKAAVSTILKALLLLSPATHS
jgi:hypothetical protein